MSADSALSPVPAVTRSIVSMSVPTRSDDPPTAEPLSTDDAWTPLIPDAKQDWSAGTIVILLGCIELLLVTVAGVWMFEIAAWSAAAIGLVSSLVLIVTGLALSRRRSR